VRGKLRDKRTEFRHDRIKRELMERRRPPKRESRLTLLHLQELLEEEDLLNEADVRLGGAQKKHPS
jgi:hypothetical protein